jgi:hypothetical protein
MMCVFVCVCVCARACVRACVTGWLMKHYVVVVTMRNAEVWLLCGCVDECEFGENLCSYSGALEDCSLLGFDAL